MRVSPAPLIAALLTAWSAHAQVVRGTAITPDSVLIPGGIVTLLNDKGTPVARALGDEGGTFTLRAPSSGSYRIEAKRLAFRPTLDAPIVLEDGKVLLHTLVLAGAPVQLAGVQVTAESRCESHLDSASAAFVVWEEARKALRSSQLTRMTRSYRADVTTFVKRQSAAGKNSGFVAGAAAFAAVGTLDPTALVAFARSILLPFQQLDDLADFAEDYANGNYTGILVGAKDFFARDEWDSPAPLTRHELLTALIRSGSLLAVLHETRVVLHDAHVNVAGAYVGARSTPATTFLVHLDRGLAEAEVKVLVAGRALARPPGCNVQAPPVSRAGH